MSAEPPKAAETPDPAAPAPEAAADDVAARILAADRAVDLDTGDAEVDALVARIVGA